MLLLGCKFSLFLLIRLKFENIIYTPKIFEIYVIKYTHIQKHTKLNNEIIKITTLTYTHIITLKIEIKY